MSSTVRVKSSGIIASTVVGVYSDSGCTVRLTSIDWGTLYPGENRSVVVYVKNEGTVPITLSLSATNWNPAAASNYMTLSWDYNGGALPVNASMLTTLTLKVSSTITGIAAFSFDVVITGSG